MLRIRKLEFKIKQISYFNIVRYRFNFFLIIILRTPKQEQSIGRRYLDADDFIMDDDEEETDQFSIPDEEADDFNDEEDDMTTNMEEENEEVGEEEELEDNRTWCICQKVVYINLKKIFQLF